MSDKPDLSTCLSYIDCQLMRKAARPSAAGKEIKIPSVTISRQTGAGGRAIATKLAVILQKREMEQTCPWTVFDRNLVEKVLEDHHLPKRLAQYMPEDNASTLNDIMEELLGLHPPSWTLFHQTTETILRLAEMGHVILVGRAANVITSRLDNMFHVRLIASLDARVERIRTMQELSRDEALEFIQREDEGRRRYLKKNFAKDIEDPLLYHIVFNTDRFTLDEAARAISEAVVAKFG